MTDVNRPRDHAFFVNLVVDYRRAKAVFVANDLGVFVALAEMPLTSGALAQKLACDARALELLLRALVAIGLLQTDDVQQTFSLTDFAAESLVPGRPGYVGNNLSFQEMIWSAWSELSDVVRTGRPRRSLGQLLSQKDQRFTEEYIRGMHNIAKLPAREVAEHLSKESVHSILDVGGGPGTFALALLENTNGATAAIMDLPSTLRVTQELLASHSHGSAVTLREGNYLTDSYGGPFDLVLLSHVTHDENESNVTRMLERAFAALEPGGRVAIHDFVTDDAAMNPLFSALFSLHMLVYTDGRCYSLAEYRRMLTAVGFVAFESTPIARESQNPSALVVARKPG